MQFDYLQMYCGLPYEIRTLDGSTIKVLQPTVGDVVRMGEESFYGSLNVFVTNTTQYRLQLWQGGIDWNEISDFDLFLLLYRMIDKSVSDMLFDGVDFTSMVMVRKKDNDLVLRDENTGMVIDKNTYECFHRYLQEMFKIKPEDDLTDDPILKQWLIDKDARKAERRAKQNKPEESVSIQPLISSLVNHPGFKYNLKELMDIGVCQFYDSVQRIQLYEQATAVLKGIFSGMVDSSKIKPEQYNWMKQL